MPLFLSLLCILIFGFEVIISLLDVQGQFNKDIESFSIIRQYMERGSHYLFVYPNSQHVTTFAHCMFLSEFLLLGNTTNVHMTVFTSFLCSSLKEPKVSNMISLLTHYSRTIGIRFVVFADDCAELESFSDLVVLRIPEANEFGLPILKDMLLELKSRFSSDLFAFVNSDILPSKHALLAPIHYFSCHPHSIVISLY